MRAGLSALSRALSESPTLKHVLASPAFSAAEKTEVLGALSERAGSPAVAKGFFGQLVLKNRTDQIPAIDEAFAELADVQKGVMSVTVSSARDLTKSQRESLQQRLHDLMGGDVAVTYHAEPDLLSGLRIQIGSTVYDSTVRNRLDTMRTLLTRE